MPTLEDVRNNLAANFPKYRDIAANEHIVDTECLRIGDIRTGADIYRVVKAVEDRLAINPEYTAFFAADNKNFWGLESEANANLLNQELNKLGLPFTAQNLERVLREDTDLQKRLTTNQKWRDKQAQAKRLKDAADHQAKETDRMISEISNYMLDATGKVKSEYLPRLYKDKIAGLRAMTFPDLEARYNEVMAARAQRKAPVEAIRAVVKTEAVQQRKVIFSTTAPEIELTNPSTGQPFTRKELVNYLNSLSRSETRAFFSFPSGKPKPGIAEAATKILKSHSI